MRLMYISLGLILLYIVAQILYSAYYARRSAELNKTTWAGKGELGDNSQPTFRLFIAGDSIAAGVGSSRFETSVTGRLANYFAKDHFVSYENVSKTGDKMKNLLTQSVPIEEQDLIVLIVSSNDHFRFTDYKEFEESTKKVFERYAPKAKRLIIIGPGDIAAPATIPLVLKPIYLLRGPKYAQIIDQAAKSYPNIIHVNPLIPPEGLPAYEHTYAIDNFHPNDEGHKYWFDMIRLGGEL